LQERKEENKNKETEENKMKQEINDLYVTLPEASGYSAHNTCVQIFFSLALLSAYTPLT
jgi:hypothetical protein